MRSTFVVLAASLLSATLHAQPAAQPPNPSNTPNSQPNSQPNVFFGDKDKKVKGSTRPVHGTVKDAAGNPIPQAIVSLKSNKTGKKLETVTREDGSYRFDELKIADDYELKAAHDKLTSPIKKLSLYDSRRDPVINFELEPTKEPQAQAKP